MEVNKRLIRAHEREDACLIFDDSIIGETYTDGKLLSSFGMGKFFC